MACQGHLYRQNRKYLAILSEKADEENKITNEPPKVPANLDCHQDSPLDEKELMSDDTFEELPSTSYQENNEHSANLSNCNNILERSSRGWLIKPSDYYY